jgi:hypothetical protein
METALKEKTSSPIMSSNSPKTRFAQGVTIKWKKQDRQPEFSSD